MYQDHPTRRQRRAVAVARAKGTDAKIALLAAISISMLAAVCFAIFTFLG